MQHADILAIAGLRVDGRRENDIRSIRHKLGVSQNADGSCYFEQGLNKVLVLVHGPQEPQRKSGDQTIDKVLIFCAQPWVTHQLLTYQLRFITYTIHRARLSAIY